MRMMRDKKLFWQVSGNQSNFFKCRSKARIIYFPVHNPQVKKLFVSFNCGAQNDQSFGYIGSRTPFEYDLIA